LKAFNQVGVALEGGKQPLPHPPAHGKDMVHDDPMHPPPEAAPSLEARKARDELDGYFLRHVAPIIEIARIAGSEDLLHGYCSP
jgi:hypothetical protein